PAAADAAEVKRDIKGARLVLTTSDGCMDAGSIRTASLTVKMKRGATWRVRSVEWQVDGRRITTQYHKPYSLRLATSGYEAEKAYELEARIFTELGQKRPRAKISTTFTTCPAVG